MAEDWIIEHVPTGMRTVIVSDPDGLTNDATIRAELRQRFEQIISGDDEIALLAQWYAVPASVASVLVVTLTALEAVPYPIWATADARRSLALAEILPGFPAQVARALPRNHLAHVAAAFLANTSYLSEEQALQFAVQVVLGRDLQLPMSSVDAVDSIDTWHTLQPLPLALLPALVAMLGASPTCAQWPIHDILRSTAVWHRFLQEQVVAAIAPGQVGEASTMARLPFATEPALQDRLPRWQRQGLLTPIVLPPHADIPAWASAIARHDADQAYIEALKTAIDRITYRLAHTETWAQWDEIAIDWATVTNDRYTASFMLPDELHQHYDACAAQLDHAWYAWLVDQKNYARLATRPLPLPHHLYHVPGWMAYMRENDHIERQALFIMDGMSLADWQRIAASWKGRHPDWSMTQRRVLAQVPSITCISRQALVSGRRPADFADTLATNAHESAEWATFWTDHDLPAAACRYIHLSPNAPELPPDAQPPHMRMLCLVSTVIDQMIHGATQGAFSLASNLTGWLTTYSGQYERLIELLLQLGYTIHITSDHGHVAAAGVGQPREGIIATTRSKRARVYPDVAFARSVQRDYAETHLWAGDALLPSSTVALLAKGRTAFAQRGELVVSHGGVTLDEVVVPLATITR